jgi:hypothetical protein
MQTSIQLFSSQVLLNQIERKIREQEIKRRREIQKTGSLGANFF